MAKLKRLYLLFIALAVVYVIFTLKLPPPAATLTKYHLTAAKAHVLGLSVIIPYIIIWGIAYRGAALFFNYVEPIKRTPEGKAMSDIASGLMTLAVTLPLSAVVAAIGNYVAYYHPSWLGAISISSNYFSLVILLLAFSKLYFGSRKLIATLQASPFHYSYRIGRLTFLAVSVLFAYLTMTNPARRLPTSNSPHPAYFLVDWLLLSTIVLPYIYIWYAGIMTAINILNYRMYIAGVIYQSALNFLAIGVGMTTLSFLLIRYLVSLTTIFNIQTLQFVLGIVYLLLILMAVGFGFITTGTKRLRRIEEV